MFYIKLADHIFKIENKYSLIESKCCDYITDENIDAYNIYISDVEIEHERTDGNRWSEGHLEMLAVYRKICEYLIQYGYILFHGSAISVDGKAVIFTAPSGTGKSTQSALWEQYMRERVVMINDDKPLIKVSEDGCTVFGTPWCGKHNRQNNMSAELKAIVYIKRSERNYIEHADLKKYYCRLFTQMYRPANDNVEGLRKSMELLGKMVEKVPIYVLHCDISKEAVDTVYDELKKDGIL